MRAILAVLAVALLTAGCLVDDAPGEGVDEASSDVSSGTDGGEPAANASQNETSDEEPDEEASDGSRDGNQTGEDGERETANATEGPPTADPGWPPLGQAEIRPGVGVGETAGPSVGGSQICTANFLFASPDNRTLHIGTAAHCVTGHEPGETIALSDTGYNARVAYAGWWNDSSESYEGDHGYDFALLALSSRAREVAHPAMLGYGGPTEMAVIDELAPGDEIRWYGNSSSRAGLDPIQENRGIVCDPGEGTEPVFFRGLPPAVGGDSGSPVMTADGQALGPLLGYRFPACPAMGGAAERIAPLPAALAQAEERGRPVELVTWPLLE